MENEKNYYINIIITQFICVTLILLSVLAVKYIFKAHYGEVVAWYNTYMCDDTSVDEVLK